MSKQINASPGDQLRRAHHREVAREIVWKDRTKRKYGHKVDTAGAIVRALEAAFSEGRNEGLQPIKPRQAPVSLATTFVEWITIPPRPRRAFWSICMASFGTRPEHEREARLVPALTERSTPGWIVETDLMSRDTRPFAERSIAPLRRLGLLEILPDQSEYLTVSERGKATWRLNCAKNGDYPAF